MPNQALPRFLATKDPLGLRRFAETDLYALFDIESDSFLKRYVGGPVTAKRLEWIRDAAKLIHNDIQFALEHIPTGVLAGRVSLGHHDSSENREIQVILAKSFIGLRLGKIAVELTIDYACDALRANHVTALVEPTHTASIRLVTELGFSELLPQQDSSGQIMRVFTLPSMGRVA